MAIQRKLDCIKFAGSGQDAEFTSVDIEYTDPDSGAYATASISFSGTPSGAGAYKLPRITSNLFEFDQTDSILDIHQRLADFINNSTSSQVQQWSATFDASAVTLITTEKSSLLNADLGETFVTAAGLTINVVAPSGGVDPTQTGGLNLMFDGSHSKLNMHSSYDAEVVSDRAYYVGKMRSEISLPAIQETVETCDANGDVIETILFF